MIRTFLGCDPVGLCGEGRKLEMTFRNLSKKRVWSEGASMTRYLAITLLLCGTVGEYVESYRKKKKEAKCS